MSAVIKVEYVSKQYRLGLVGTGTMRDDLEGWWYRVRGKEDPTLRLRETNDRTSSSDSNYVWALRDVNFEVKQGEVLGIIGKNGAGKSTLLKLLSRVTAPTIGNIKVKGRIASLLEVGTGFHPELTGKENIFLNGAIMGMKKHEIASKLDEIVDFAGVERYLETPVKRYSSGMYVRLAFAVAAHLEPEILIVDEVLAVGDADFQKKALGKMKEVSSGSGRTVLFVSHNMASVKSLCNRALLLENGQVRLDSYTSQVISAYLGIFNSAETQNHRVFGESFNLDLFHLHSVAIEVLGKIQGKPIEEDDAIEVITVITLKTDHPERYHITYHLHSGSGDPVFSFGSDTVNLKSGMNILTCRFPAGFLQSDEYFLSFLFIEDKHTAIFKEKDILQFAIINAPRELGIYMGKEPGYVRPRFEWDISTK